jgi:hypothetical protein
LYRSGIAVTSLFGTESIYHDAVTTLEAALDTESAPASGYGIAFRYVDDDY